MTGTDGPRTRRTARLAAVPVLALAVAGAVYLIARSVTPDYTTGLFGQHLDDAVRLKAWLATVILALAGAQLLLALWMYRRIPGVSAAPPAVARVHRVTGVVLFLCTVPIAVHCIQTYGLELTPARAAVHALSACFFYGAFAAKVLIVRSARLPGWLLPLAGGLLVATIVLLWYTSALWFFNGYQSPGF